MPHLPMAQKGVAARTLTKLYFMAAHCHGLVIMSASMTRLDGFPQELEHQD